MTALDRIDLAPGWKSAILGGFGIAFLFVNDLLVYLDREPLPESLYRSGALMALWVGAMALKLRREAR